MFLQRLKKYILPKGGLTERAVVSGAWSGATNTLARVIQLVKVIILARLLSPAEFGLFGIGMLVLAVFRQFSSLGIDESLIQRKEEQVDEYLNTAWTIGICRGVLIATIAIVTAPHAAALFDESRAILIIGVLGLSPLIRGLRNPGVMYFQKNLEFHRDFFMVLSAVMVNFVVAVTYGVIFHNVWALIFGSLAGDITMVLMSYILHQYRPWPDFEFQRAKEMIDYGKWIFGMVSIRFLLRQGDDAFIGWFLGATSLGFYQMAYQFSNAPATEITEVISKVAFPAYSQIQDSQTKLKKGLYQTIRLSTFISFPTSMGIIAIAPLFVELFLGSDWSSVIPVMQLLAVYGVLRSLTASMGSLFKAVGRPDIITKLVAGQVIIIASLIYPATDQFGLIGASIVIILSGAIFDVPVSVYLAVRSVNGSFRKLAGILIYPVIGSVLMMGGVWMLRRTFTSGILFVDFIIAASAGILIYTSLIVVAVTVFDYGIKHDLRTIYESLS